jgi:hypothetical protein
LHRQDPDTQLRFVRIGCDNAVVVVVDAKRIQRRLNRRQIPVPYDVEPAGGSVVLEHVGGILAAQQRVQEQAVTGAVQATGGGDILVAVAGGLDVGQQEGDADPYRAAAGAERLGG